MRQLPLEIRPADYAVFEAYFGGANALAAQCVRAAAGRPGWALIWLWGPRASGRSHLLQAAVDAAGKGGESSAYLPVRRMLELGSEAVAGFGETQLIAVDDIELAAGNALWEHALFGLYESLLACGGRLLIAASAPPMAAGFRLADLQSRFAAGTVCRLQPLSDDDAMRALQLRARRRGIEVPEETARYLLSRVERSLPRLFEWLDRLDREALAAQRSLTVPFVRSVFDSSAA